MTWHRTPLACALLAGCVAPRAPPPPVVIAPPRPAERPVVTRTGTSVRLDDPLIQGALVHGRAEPGARLTLDDVPVPVAADGRFVFGLDRDAAATVRLVEHRSAPEADVVATDVLPVAPRDWPVSRLPGLPRIPVPDAEFARVRPAELARIAAARAIDTGAEGWRQMLRWPLTGRISTRFGARRSYAGGQMGEPHSGIDIARPTGTPVLAPADGVVVLAADRPFTLEGNLLMIDHGMGLGSAFLHLSRILVPPGAAVRQGQPIGLVGATGRATGPHLHWSLRWRDARLDPLLAAGAMPTG